MRVLVTGATGFVGQHVVRAIAQRGHIVRELVRCPGRAGNHVRSTLGVVEVQGDLLQPETLPNALNSIDVVVHLAISVTDDRDILLDETIQGTRNLCDAMVLEGVTRIIHCSSRAVYDSGRAERNSDESAPLETGPDYRDEYAKAKILQEQLIGEYAAKHHWAVTMFRPGFIWGHGREQLAGWGHSLGPVHLVVDGSRELPMSYVENCAECFALAVDEPRAAGQAFNVVDDDLPTTREYARRVLKLEGLGGILVSVPYWPGMLLAKFATATNRTLFGGRIDLPGLLVPSRYQARFRPLHFSNRKAKELLGWRPRYNFNEAWERARRGMGTEAIATIERAGSGSQEAMRGN